MAQFSKFKLLEALKLNFNGGQFYKETPNFGYFKKLKYKNTVLKKFNICNRIVKFQVENFEHLH